MANADTTAHSRDHAGHRARLRGRLLSGDADGMADCELVEYLLALAIPRRDTKPLVKAPLREFGSLAQLISADPESLRRVDGLADTGAAALKIVQAASLRLLKGKFRDKLLLSSWDALLDWLRADMGPIDIERARVLYLNSRNMLIRDELASEGSIDQSAVYVREIVKRALELLVHRRSSSSTTTPAEAPNPAARTSRSRVILPMPRAGWGSTCTITSSSADPSTAVFARWGFCSAQTDAAAGSLRRLHHPARAC
jgi:DNA repair protein RadC